MPRERHQSRRRVLVTDAAGQSSIEWAGILAAVVVVVAAAIALAPGVGRSLTCSIDTILGHPGCSSSSTQPYAEACIVSQSSDAGQLALKVAFIKVTDNDTLLTIRRSDGSASFILTHTGSVQAEAALKAELEAGNVGFDGELSAAAGGQLIGAQQWDFTSPQAADAFANQVHSSGGWNQIAHDIANGLPPGVSWLANQGLDLLGIHDGSGLQNPTSTYVGAGVVAGAKGKGNLGLGPASANVDAAVQAAGGARLILSGRQKGDVVLYINLNGNANGKLQADIFGVQGANAGLSGQGSAVATMTLDPSGKPLSLNITANAGYTGNLGAGSALTGKDAQAVKQWLKSVSVGGGSGSGQGIQWMGALDLQRNPQDVAALTQALTGDPAGLNQLEQDFNTNGTERVQPYHLQSSNVNGGAELDVGIGLGAEGSQTNQSSNFNVGSVKLPGGSWQPVTCKR